MHILIVGGTGFIGSNLTHYFSQKGHNVTVTSREVDKFLNNHEIYYDVIINLAGEPLHKHRWNDRVKKNIYDSRINTTKKIIDYIKSASQKPKALISGSAIGFYGNDNQKEFTEESSFHNNGFTEILCRDWENTAMEAQTVGVRVCLLRTGIVLGKEGGALKQMLLPFKCGLGGKLGDGKQWMSWIHKEDMVRIIDFLIKHENLAGPFNCTSPNPVTNEVFTKVLGEVLKRPAILNMPKFIVEILFGEMGKILLLNGQKVMPARLLEAGYQFKFPTLLEALKNILN